MNGNQPKTSEARSKELSCIHRNGCPKPHVCRKEGYCTSMTESELKLHADMTRGEVDAVIDQAKAARTSKQRCDQRLRNKIGGFLLEPDTRDGGDTLAIALCSYFERHIARPMDDTESENGWSAWAEARTNQALDALTLAVMQPSETKAPLPEAAAAQILNVASWLQRGCDITHAITELTIIASKLRVSEEPPARREYHARGTYWSGVPTVSMPCDFCQRLIMDHDPRTHACPPVETNAQIPREPQPDDFITCGYRDYPAYKAAHDEWKQRTSQNGKGDKC